MVHHPGACAVVALVRQFREAVRSWLLEIPAGIRDVTGESAAECAARELLEETGYRAVTIAPLGSVLTSPGFADERIDLFVARTDEDPTEAPVEEGIEVVRWTFAEAVAAVGDGRIDDAKTIAALMLAGGRLAASPGSDSGTE